MAGRVVAAALLAGLAGIGAVASVRAHEGFGFRGWHGGPHGHGRWSALSPEDRAAFTDARIAALHAGMKLNPDQEKLWPPVEAAIRDLAKLREARRAGRDERPRFDEDAPAALRGMADAATARGEALRKLADATAPLYATLDEGQKRRARMLARPMGPGFGHGGWGHGDRGGPGKAFGEEPGSPEAR